MVQEAGEIPGTLLTWKLVGQPSWSWTVSVRDPLDAAVGLQHVVHASLGVGTGNLHEKSRRL